MHPASFLVYECLFTYLACPMMAFLRPQGIWFPSTDRINREVPSMIMISWSQRQVESSRVGFFVCVCVLINKMPLSEKENVWRFWLFINQRSNIIGWKRLISITHLFGCFLTEFCPACFSKASNWPAMVYIWILQFPWSHQYAGKKCLNFRRKLLCCKALLRTRLGVSSEASAFSRGAVGVCDISVPCVWPSFQNQDLAWPSFQNQDLRERRGCALRSHHKLQLGHSSWI